MATSLIPVAVSDQIALAQQLAASNLLPDQYRKNPANLLWAIQYAQALGVHPMTAVTGIAVINGKPTASAQLIGGLVRRAGHKLRVESSDTKAVATIIRADDPTYEFRVEWTMDRAKRAGLGGRGPWQQYPAAMLTARAITEVARMAAPEALFGIIYTPEELGADVDDEGVIVDATIVATPAPVPVAEMHHPAEEIVLGGTDRYAIEDAIADGERPAARNQITRIAILRRELALDDETYRKRLESLYGVTTSKALTEIQAAELIEKLTAAKQKVAGGAE
jgi:hypothetical protein